MNAIGVAERRQPHLQTACNFTILCIGACCWEITGGEKALRV
jgi:hypothetical protein